ncbi:peptidyl-prolyl cis-trans isomerase [Pseudomaricurvus alcaniphilus]|uniref:peptidylprolyl isomerase n=1 Tax=Pseudomaricurvus alcaniphilus TaxID=1166482 RepID=UPI00140E2903|nr:peptidylprolyl isomerase [Pseudomaricurvus alcaniphilus]NHN37469.1 peptidyl-prolyl cis-trans isomerase [Pseudomaricurvus alcaniphilus]
MTCIRNTLLTLTLVFCSLGGNCFAAADAATVAPGTPPRVLLKTDLGNITLELFADKAPATVANFLQYCREGFYVGTIFHRVIPGFVVQGGGLTFDYVRKETRDPVVNESGNGLRNRTGTVAMARLGDPDSATSQFYINLRDNKHLDPDKDKAGYTVFGQVLEGMDVVRKITEEPQGKYQDQAPDLPVRILAVTIL